MSNSNLPPGVTENMIPGNSPQDMEWDRVIDEMITWCERKGVEPMDAFLAIKDAAPDAVVKGYVHCEAAKAFNEGKTSVLMLHKEDLDDHGPCRFHIYEE